MTSARARAASPSCGKFRSSTTSAQTRSPSSSISRARVSLRAPRACAARARCRAPRCVAPRDASCAFVASRRARAVRQARIYRRQREGLRPSISSASRRFIHPPNLRAQPPQQSCASGRRARVWCAARRSRLRRRRAPRRRGAWRCATADEVFGGAAAERGDAGTTAADELPRGGRFRAARVASRRPRAASAPRGSVRSRCTRSRRARRMCPLCSRVSRQSASRCGSSRRATRRAARATARCRRSTSCCACRACASATRASPTRRRRTRRARAQHAGAIRTSTATGTATPPRTRPAATVAR